MVRITFSFLSFFFFKFFPSIQRQCFQLVLTEIKWAFSLIRFFHQSHNTVLFGGVIYIKTMDNQFTEAWYSPKGKYIVLFLCKEPPKTYCIMGSWKQSIGIIRFQDSDFSQKSNCQEAFYFVLNVVLSLLGAESKIPRGNNTQVQRASLEIKV